MHSEDTYKTHVTASGQRKLQCRGEPSGTQPGQWKEVLVLQEKLGGGVAVKASSSKQAEVTGKNWANVDSSCAEVTQC